MKKRYERNHFKAFSNSVNHKKLYKKGKNWVIGSLTLLALAGLGVTTNHSVHADGDANTKAATTSVGSTANIEQKSKAMYNQMIAHSMTNSSAGQPTQNNGVTPKSNSQSTTVKSTESASIANTSTSNSASAASHAVSSLADNQTKSTSSVTKPHFNSAYQSYMKQMGKTDAEVQNNNVNNQSQSAVAQQSVHRVLGLTNQAPQMVALRYWGNSTVTFYNNGDVKVSGGLIGIPSDFAHQVINYRSDHNLPYKPVDQLTNSDYANAVNWDDNVQINNYDQDFSDFYNNAQVNHIVPLSNVKHIILSDVKLPKYAGGMFQNLPDLQAVTGNMINSDTNSMETMFRNDPKLVNISAMNGMKLAPTIHNMFENDVSLNDSANGVLNSMDYSKVSDAGYFLHNTGIVHLDTRTWNIHPTDMADMFANMKNLSSINVSKFDTSKVQDFSSLFVSDPSLVNLDLSHFNTQNATAMNNMFGRDTSLQNLDLSSFDTHSVTDMAQMFESDADLQNLNLGKNIKLSNDTELPNNWMTTSDDHNASQNDKDYVPVVLDNNNNHSGKWTRNAKVINFLNKDNNNSYLGHAKYFTSNQDWANHKLNSFTPSENINGFVELPSDSSKKFNYDTSIGSVHYENANASDLVDFTYNGKVVPANNSKNSDSDASAYGNHAFYNSNTIQGQRNSDTETRLNSDSDFENNFSNNLLSGNFSNMPDGYTITPQEKTHLHNLASDETQNQIKSATNGSTFTGFDFGNNTFTIPLVKKTNIDIIFSTAGIGQYGGHKYLSSDTINGYETEPFNLNDYSSAVPKGYTAWLVSNKPDLTKTAQGIVPTQFSNQDQLVDVLVAPARAKGFDTNANKHEAKHYPTDIKINVVPVNNHKRILNSTVVKGFTDTPFNINDYSKVIPKGWTAGNPISSELLGSNITEFPSTPQTITIMVAQSRPNGLKPSNHSYKSNITVHFVLNTNHKKVLGTKSFSNQSGTPFDINKLNNDVPNGYVAEFINHQIQTLGDKQINQFTTYDQSVDIPVAVTRPNGFIPNPSINVSYVDMDNHRIVKSATSKGTINHSFNTSNYTNQIPSDYHFIKVLTGNDITKYNYQPQSLVIGIKHDTSSIQINYEDVVNGSTISSEANLISNTNSSFNISNYYNSNYAPSSISGYHQITILHPTASFDPKNGDTHTIDVLYTPDSSSSTNISSATDTINYLISGTNSAVAPSSTDSVEFSRAVSSASGQAPYGKWMTNSAFAPVTYNSVITSNGIRYQEVSANTAVPTPNMASDDFNANRIASFSNDIYYVPAKANVHVYFEAESDGHQLASQSDFTSSVNASFSLANYENRFNNAGYHYVTALHSANSYDPSTGEVHTIDLLYAKNNQTTSNVAPESAAVIETTYDEWNNGRTNVSEAASTTTYHYTRNGSLVYNPTTKNYSDHYSDWRLLNNSSTSNRSINLNGYYYETTVGNLPSAATLQNLAPNASLAYSDYQLYAPNSASYNNSAVSGSATETVNYYLNNSLVSSATYSSGVNLNRNAIVSAGNHNYVVDSGGWSVASGRGFALPSSASFAGYYATSSNGNVPLNTLNIDPGNYSENVYYSPAKANIHVYYENADNGSELAKPSEFTSSVNVPFQMSTLGDYKNEFNNANYHFVGLMHPASNYDPNNNETHTIDLLYAPNQSARHQTNAYSSIHVHYIDSDNHPVTVNGRVSDNFNHRQAGTAFTMPHISDVAGYQSGNENVINPVTKFSSDNGHITNVYVQYHKVVPGVQPITVNYLSSDNTELGSAKYTNANTTMSDIRKGINDKTFNNYTHVNTLNMPSGFTTHPQNVYVIYRPDHPVIHHGHIHVRYVDENNHDREFWSDKYSDNSGTPFDLRIDNYNLRYVPDRVFDKVISGYVPGHPINFGNQSATDPYVIVVGYVKPKPKSSASATPSSTASLASSKASSASSKASSSVAPSASSLAPSISSVSQPSSNAPSMSSKAIVPPVVPSQSSATPQKRNTKPIQRQHSTSKIEMKRTKPVYIPKNGKDRKIRHQVFREIKQLKNRINQDINQIHSRTITVHKYDNYQHIQRINHEIHVKRQELNRNVRHLRKLEKAHKLPQTSEPQSYSALYAMLFVLSSVILAGLGRAIDKRWHD